MAGLDDIPHIKQAQARHGFAIGGIKSHLKFSRQKADATDARLHGVETLTYAICVFIAVFLVTLLSGFGLPAYFR